MLHKKFSDTACGGGLELLGKLFVNGSAMFVEAVFKSTFGFSYVLFVNRSAMFVEAVFKSTFGFSDVLFVTVVTLYHVFGVAVNVMITKSSFHFTSYFLLSSRCLEMGSNRFFV